MGLGHRLWQAFLIQALLISVAALLGVFAARHILGDVLIRAALENEAAFFWAELGRDHDHPRPDTYNLTAYLAGADEIPANMRALAPGFHELSAPHSDFYVIHVSEREGRRLWLAFDGKKVSRLALFFGLLPLAVVLIIIYLSSWLGYRFSRQAVSPVIKLAQAVEKIEPKLLKAEPAPPNMFNRKMDQEVAVLARALDNFAGRIRQFVSREQNFTRDASHELRSPITVIKIATDVMLADESLSAPARGLIGKIKRAARDMEELIDALLLLARESEDQLSSEPVSVNALAAEEIDRARLLYREKPVRISKREEGALVVEASPKVLGMVIGNILRNACMHTDEGEVRVIIGHDHVCIEDSGAGIAEEDVRAVFKPFHRGASRPAGGHGVGLTIVKMLSDRFDWPVSIDSAPNAGARVRIGFPAHSVIHY